MIGYNECINLRSANSKVLGTILGNVDGFTFGSDVETQMGYLDGYFDSSDDSRIKDLLISTDGKVIGPMLGNVDGITLGLSVKIELGSLDGSSDGLNDVKLEGIFLGDSLGSTDGKVVGSNEG